MLEKYEPHRDNPECVSEMEATLEYFVAKEKSRDKVDAKKFKRYVTSLVEGQVAFPSGQKKRAWVAASDVEGMPSDARFDFIFVPTAIAVATLTLFRQRFPQEAGLIRGFDGALRSGMEFSTLNGFRGHGYDAADGMLRLLRVFASGQVFRFVDDNPSFCPKMSEALKETVCGIETALASGETTGTWDENYRKEYEACSVLVRDQSRHFCSPPQRSVRSKRQENNRPPQAPPSRQRQLDSLYELQATAKNLTHGIRSVGWQLFEPSRFVYAFFAFNSLYSIDWQRSRTRENLISWTHEDHPFQQEQRRPREEDQFYGMLDFITEALGEEKFRSRLAVKIKQHLSRCRPSLHVADVEGLFPGIWPDANVTQRIIDNFKMGFASIMNRHPEDEHYRRHLNNVIFFIYKVRNNVFHGLKTILHMMDGDQGKRLGLYSAVLLGVNDVLIEAIEKNEAVDANGRAASRWTRRHVDAELSCALRDDRERQQHMFLQRTLASRIRDLKFPAGALFYPCCGNDTWVPIQLFLDSVDEFHFIDIASSPEFPALECSIAEDDLTDARRIIPVGVASGVKDLGESPQFLDNEITEQLKRLREDEPWHFPANTVARTQEWDVEIGRPRKVRIVNYRQDGLSVFLGLDKISVFFLRGDSMGEGGSGQMWFQKKLVDLILEKLVDGGLIVTDGSGAPCSEDEFSDSPWKGLWQNTFARSGAIVKEPDDFEYGGKSFKCLGCCEHRYGPVYVWQVSTKPKNPRK